MLYSFLLFAGLALLGAVYMCRAGFAVLKKAGLVNSTRVAGWLTAMNVFLAVLLAPTSIALHFMTKRYFDIPTACIWYLFGLVNPIMLWGAVYFFIKFLALFRWCPSRFWIFSTISGILFGWTAWLLLNFLFFSDIIFT